jgi:putative ABC transport system permease protein
MQFTENIKEGLRSIRDNLLRTSLTVAIIALGITSLVGILTAIDSIQSSITSGLADLGANTFDIKDKAVNKKNRRGMQERTKTPLEYDDVIAFKNEFQASEMISISTFAAGAVEVKRLSEKTNPNVSVEGIDENYLAVKSYNLEKGRPFASTELRTGAYVCIIGLEIAAKLFDKENPIDKTIYFLNAQYKVIGVLEDKGSGGGGGGGTKRKIYVPLVNARALGVGKDMVYTMIAYVKDVTKFEYSMEEARGLMRRIRKDANGKPDSFELSRSESLAATLDETAGTLRLGGFAIGFITLIGAAIGLMNIMMVSVTERTREIGVRKALGATPAKIRQQFLIEAIVICQIGGVVGVLMGIGIGNIVARLLNSTEFIIPWLWIFLSFIVCIVVGVVSGFYPAYKASKLDPIESLRYE